MLPANASRCHPEPRPALTEVELFTMSPELLTALNSDMDMDDTLDTIRSRNWGSVPLFPFSPDERPLSKMMFEIQSDAGPLTMNDFCIKF